MKLLLLATLLAAQNGPPELVNPNRDPFPRPPLGQSQSTPKIPKLNDAEEWKRSREDLARLLELTSEVRKAMDAANQHIADLPTARRLEEIEKIAKRMRKRFTR